MDAVSEVKSRLSIEDVVSEYVQLKRSGRNYKGLSPFGNEKTPSFMVSPEKQIWHDFSSGKGGDMFTFIQEVEGLDFKETLEILARKAGVDLEQFRGQTTNSKLKERLHQALDLAAKFYQAQLKNNQLALEYLFNKRGFNKETVLTFRLGYSPNTGDALYKFLKGKKFTDEEMSKAGLITTRYRGPGDMFRSRIMVPLSDARGQVVGFTARQLIDDKDSPKYINTPSTILYDKGRQAYGLHLAKEAIRKSKFAIVVEGNLDVIASHQAGIKNVVAAAGTALTEMHLKEIGRYADDIRFAFDSDQAGINATERAIPLAQKTGVNVSIINIPSGKDPDELIKQDPKLWEQAISSNQYAVDWLIDRYKSMLNVDSGQGKRQFTDIILRVLKNLSDSVERDHYLKRLAEITGVSYEAVKSKMEQQPEKNVRLKKPNIKAVKTVDADKQKNEQHLLAILLMQPKTRTVEKILNQDMFDEGPARQLFDFLSHNPKFDGDSKEIKQLQPISDYVKISTLLFDELYRSLELTELNNEVTRLQGSLIARYVKQQKQQLNQLMASASESDMRHLQEADKKLNDLLNDSKGK